MIEMQNDRMAKAHLSGFPSKDKVHEKYYSEGARNYQMPSKTLYDYLFEKNELRLDKPAFNYFDHRITYRELFRFSTDAARSLYRLGVRKGDFVTLVLPSIPEAFYLFFGISRLGAIANLVDPRYGEKAIAHKIQEAGSRIVFCLDSCLKTYNRKTKKHNTAHVLDKVGSIIEETPAELVISVPPSASINFVSLLKNDLLRQSFRMTRKSVFREHISWKDFLKIGKDSSNIVFPIHEPHIPVAVASTGGSTGTPKGVLLSNENIISATIQCTLSGLAREEGRWYDIMPISIVYGMADGSIYPLSLGYEVRLVPDPTAMSVKYPGQLWIVEDFVRFDPHTIACAPNHVSAIVESEVFQKKPHSIVNFIVGGDSLNKSQLDRANVLLSNMKRPSDFDADYWLSDRSDPVVINTGYGESEGTAANSVAPNSNLVRSGTVGIILPCETMTTFRFDDTLNDYVELPYVRSEEVQFVTREQIGEICVQGPNVMLGYLNNPEETAKAIVSHSDGQRWLHTGDLGFIDDDGYVHFVDRAKYISVGADGFKVAPVEIEDTILKDQRIDACKAVIFDDPTEERGTLIKVYYTLKNPGASGVADEIELTANEACQKELADYKCPVAYELLEKMPLTGSGKIDVMFLRDDANKKAKMDLSV